MIWQTHKLSRIGLALILIALLTIGAAATYVWLAQRTYAARLMLIIRPASPNASPIRPENLPLGSLRYDRDITIEFPRNSSMFIMRAFGPTPDAAVEHVNKSARELEEQVRRSLNASVSIVESATANPHPVRPNRKAIFILSGAAALNLAFLGIVFLLIGWAKARRVLKKPLVPA